MDNKVSCSVPGCPSGLNPMQKELSSLRWHCFPKPGSLITLSKKDGTSDSVDQRTYWLEKLKLTEEEAQKNDLVCSLHFSKKDYLNYVKGSKDNRLIGLDKNAVPCRNLPKKHSVTSLRSEVVEQRPRRKIIKNKKYGNDEEIDGKSQLQCSSHGKRQSSSKIPPIKIAKKGQDNEKISLTDTCDKKSVIKENQNERKKSKKPATKCKSLVPQEVQVKQEGQDNESQNFKSDFEFINVQDILNVRNMKQEPTDGNSEIHNENIEMVEEKQIKTQVKLTEDASTQTDSEIGFGEMVDYIRNNVLDFTMKAFEKEFILEECVLYFQPKLGVECKVPSKVGIKKNNLSCSNLLLLKSLNLSLQFYERKCGRSIREITGFYKMKKANGMYEVIDSVPNQNHNKLYDEKLQSFQGNIPKQDAVDSRPKIKVLKPDEMNKLLLEKLARVTIEPKVKVLTSNELKDEKLKNGLKKIFQSRSFVKNNLPVISKNVNAEVLKKVVNAPLVTGKTGTNLITSNRFSLRNTLKESSGMSDKKINIVNESSTNNSNEREGNGDVMKYNEINLENTGLQSLVEVELEEFDEDIQLEGNIEVGKAKISGDIRKRKIYTQNDNSSEPENKRSKTIENVIEIQNIQEIESEKAEGDTSFIYSGNCFKCSKCLAYFIGYPSYSRHNENCPQRCENGKFKNTMKRKRCSTKRGENDDHAVLRNLKLSFNFWNKQSMERCLKDLRCCQICKMVLHKNTLIRHRKHNCPEVLECQICPKKFTLNCNFKNHLEWHRESCCLCQKCGVIFLSSGLDTHRFRCEVPIEATLEPFENLYYAISNNKFSCKLCLRPFGNLLSFAKHVYEEHKNRLKEFKMKIKAKNMILKKYRTFISKNYANFSVKPSSLTLTKITEDRVQCKHCHINPDCNKSNKLQN